MSVPDISRLTQDEAMALNIYESRVSRAATRVYDEAVSRAREAGEPIPKRPAMPGDGDPYFARHFAGQERSGLASWSFSPTSNRHSSASTHNTPNDAAKSAQPGRFNEKHRQTGRNMSDFEDNSPPLSRDATVRAGLPPSLTASTASNQSTPTNVNNARSMPGTFPQSDEEE